MQLVERGLTSLDDPTIIPAHLPELAEKKVLTGYTVGGDGKRIWEFEERKADITPRMLMDHTYGGGHTYMNEMLFQYLSDQPDFDWTSTHEASDPYGVASASPLLWQPGTHANYAQGFDWIAVLIERVTKRPLGEYLAENIFEPLGMKDTRFEPAFGGPPLSSPPFWPRVLRNADGGYTTIDPEHTPTILRADAFPAGPHHTGCLGTGLVSTAADYTRLLTIFLPPNNGTLPLTQKQILTPQSVNKIMTPSLPPSLRTFRSIPTSTATPIIHSIDLSSPHIDPQGSYGLGCGVQGADRVLSDGRKGRSKGSVYWFGAANTEFWADREEGIVVYVNGNYYPWNDEQWLGFVGNVEGEVYGGLE